MKEITSLNANERWFVNKAPFRISPEKSLGHDNTFGIKSLEDFPLIEDFEIRMLGDSDSRLGGHLRFYSEQFGNLTSFPWWDHVDEMVKDWTIKDIPLGSLSEPFDDGEQGWRVMIFSENDYVYILEGDEIGCREFKTWYKVKKEKYIEEWEKVLGRRVSGNKSQ